jgi:hypothetical protein
VPTGSEFCAKLRLGNQTVRWIHDEQLRSAASARRLDFTELLLLGGADIRAVRLADVLLTWEPKVIRFFLDHGADPLDGRPFSEAFAQESAQLFGRSSNTNSHIRESHRNYRNSSTAHSAIFAVQGPEMDQFAHVGWR